MRLIQPVLLHNFCGELGVTSDSVASHTPAVSRSVLAQDESHNYLDAEQEHRYSSDASKIMHLMCWICPTIMNTVCGINWYMAQATIRHIPLSYVFCLLESSSAHFCFFCQHICHLSPCGGCCSVYFKPCVNTCHFIVKKWFLIDSNWVRSPGKDGS